MIAIEHPTDRVNFTIVHLGGYSVAFSYKTAIGYRQIGRPWEVAVNTWGPTTGKHCNWLDYANHHPERKKERITYTQLETIISQASRQETQV